MRRLTLRYCTAWQQQETKEKSIKAMELKAKELKPKVHPRPPPPISNESQHVSIPVLKHKHKAPLRVLSQP